MAETQETKGPRLTVRLEPDMEARLLRVIEKSRRSKTSILEECLEKELPKLERRYLKKAA